MSELVFERPAMTGRAAGEYVASLRRFAGISRKALADQVGLSERQLIRIEQSGGNPSVRILRALLRELGGSLDQFAELLETRQSTPADARRAAAARIASGGGSIADLASQIKDEAELEALIQAWHARTD